MVSMRSKKNYHHLPLIYSSDSYNYIYISSAKSCVIFGTLDIHTCMYVCTGIFSKIFPKTLNFSHSTEKILDINNTMQTLVQ